MVGCISSHLFLTAPWMQRFSSFQTLACRGTIKISLCTLPDSVNDDGMLMRGRSEQQSSALICLFSVFLLGWTQKPPTEEKHALLSEADELGGTNVRDKFLRRAGFVLEAEQEILWDFYT